MDENVAFDSLILRRTHFGWTLNGIFPHIESSPPFASTMSTQTCCLATVNIEEQHDRFWKMEDVAVAVHNPPNVGFCDHHFIENTTRVPNGQFVVKLPIKASPALLQPNRNNVISLFCRSERRINPDLWDQYAAYIAEYENLGHMSPVPSSPLDYFIPHHAVL